jgi:hypothetical protein
MFKRLLPRYDNAADMTTAQNSINNAANSGNAAINSYDPTAAGNSSTGAVTSNFNTNQAQNASAVDPLQKVINSNPTVTSLYQQGNALYNVPQLATQATDLSNRLTDVTPNAYQAAKGFDIDSTDIGNGIANASAYLGPQSGRATANYNTAAGLASNFVNAGQLQNAQNLIPAQENATLTAQNMAAEQTGWNQAQKSILDGLLAKMQSGVQLSQTEMTTAQQLAATEEAYNAQVSVNQTAVQTAQIGQQYKILNPAQTLANTFTGKSVKAA